jgi:ADP-ribosylglycohydrolase
VKRLNVRNRRNFEAFAGCLLGGAVGDALGAPAEFMSLREIRKRFGNDGITKYVPAYGRLGAITDDTQMTLFTTEGLLRAQCRWSERGICHLPSVLHHAYIRWVHTQGEKSAQGLFTGDDDGWLITLPELHHRRAPGNTCVSALVGAERGTMEKPLNNSKGCGGVMRVAPVGLFASEDEAFELGCELAAITHGHPSGYLAAGTLSLIIAYIVAGKSLETSIEESLTSLQTKPQHQECLTAFQNALSLSRDVEATVSPETVERLGQGWVAEEALAISLYCSLVAGNDFRKGVSLAVNHGGDSDSTGAITGNILGTLLGRAAIPAEWLEPLELRQEIEDIAGDLLTGFEEGNSWWAKYPGW